MRRVIRSSGFLWGIVAAALVSSFFHQGGVQPAYAQQAGAGQLFAVTAPGASQGQNVLYVIDSQTLRLMVYEHRAGGQLKLAAVRNMEYELQFQEWPDLKTRKAKVQVPSVDQVRKALRPRAPKKKQKPK